MGKQAQDSSLDTMRRLLQRAIADEVLLYEPHDFWQRGRLTWQTDTQRWAILRDDYATRRHGGKRAGAGGVAGNQNARKYPKPADQTSDDNLIVSQAGDDNLIVSDQTSCDNLIVSDGAKTIKLSQPAREEAGNIAASHVSAPLLVVSSSGTPEKKEEDTEKKETHTRSADASRKRARSKPDQVEIDYRVELLGKIAEENRFSNPRSLPQYDGQWKAAGQFCAEGMSVDDALDFYRAERKRPYWRSNALTLQTLFTHLGAWRADRKAYLAGVASAIEAATGAYVRNVTPGAPRPPVRGASASRYKTQDAHERL
jgi:hypothetical protein